MKIRGFDISAKRWGWAEMERVLVTGIPRSGTTLVTAMINDLDRSLCLSEPSRHVEWLETSSSRREYADHVIGDFDSVLAEIKRNGKVFDRRSADGASVTNYFERGLGGKVCEKFTVMEVSVTVEGEDFLLGFKHNAHYTGVLSEFADSGIPILAIVRNPVDVILSWRSLTIPITSGRLPAAERFWPEIAEIVQSDSDILQKQVRIYSLFTRRYLEFSGAVNVLRYEDIVEQPAILAGHFGRLSSGTIAVNPVDSRLYPNSAERDTIRRCLDRHGDPCIRSFYPDF